MQQTQLAVLLDKHLRGTKTNEAVLDKWRETSSATQELASGQSLAPALGFVAPPARGLLSLLLSLLLLS